MSIGVRFEGISFSYAGRPVLVDVNARVRPGERTAFVGPNGGGKTTLVRILLGLAPPDTGRVVFTDATGHEVARPRIGYLPQRTSLAVDAPVSGVDLVSLSLAPGPGFGRPAARVEARDALLDAGLSAGLLERPVGRLSGGQRQRVLLARAIAGSPSLLVLDEPDTALDAEGLMTLRRLVSEAVAAGRTVVCVTHDSDAMGGADALLRIDGTVREDAA